MQFADDTIIFTNNKSIEDGMKSLLTNINRIINYFQSAGLEIAPNKSQQIIFSN